MIEVKQAMALPAAVFYQYLVDSLTQDYLQAHPEGSKDDIKEGLEYTKVLRTKLSSKGSVTVHVKHLIENTNYTATFSSNQGVNSLSYGIEEISPESIEVTYHEQFESASKLTSLNHKWMSKLYVRKDTRRIQQILSQIEIYLKETQCHD